MSITKQFTVNADNSRYFKVSGKWINAVNAALNMSNITFGHGLIAETGEGGTAVSVPDTPTTPSELPAGTFFLVRIVDDLNGDLGNSVDKMTVTYDVYEYGDVDLAREPLGEGMTPTRQRHPSGRMLPGDDPGNSAPGLGLAFYDDLGNIVLWSANEILDTETC